MPLVSGNLDYSVAGRWTRVSKTDRHVSVT